VKGGLQLVVAVVVIVAVLFLFQSAFPQQKAR